MQFSGSRGHPKFNLDGGLPTGRTNIIKAAKDPVRPPEDPQWTDLLARCLCRVKIGEDCYIVTGMSGAERVIQYADPFSKWIETCEELLALAINENPECAA